VGAKDKILKRGANWDICRENILEPVGIQMNGAMKGRGVVIGLRR
jgi:hypothetical protein